MDIIEMAKRAKQASAALRNTDNDTRNRILTGFADGLLSNSSTIIHANESDMAAAEADGMSASLLDRLYVDEKRIAKIAEGVRQLSLQPDPIHEVLEDRIIASGIHLKKISVPLGVIGIIYEARPNVTADCAALCLKSGNACVLKGGKESYETSYAIVSVLKKVLQENGVSADSVMLAEKISHEETARFMACREYLDVLIPRGSRRLIQSVVEHAKVPVIETGAGICHVYVEKTADFAMAEKIILNAKCQRPSVCNAMETLLVEEEIADRFIPEIAAAFKAHGVKMYGDERSVQLCSDILPGAPDCFDTEYNDLIVNIGIVKDTEAAIAHIEKHGTHHSDAIITEDPSETEKFMNGVDSACVYVNASTRFTDGFEFGLGAEIGISTQKLHARGPMGLKALTTYTYHLYGKGEIRK